MPDLRAIPLSQVEWEEEIPGIRRRESTVDGSRWVCVEYAEGAFREEWCEEGHRGFVIDGEIEYEFADGRTPLRAGRGDAFLLTASIAHRGRNLASGPTTMFLIDDPSDG